MADKNILLFGGAGTGKSTLALAIYTAAQKNALEAKFVQDGGSCTVEYTQNGGTVWGFYDYDSFEARMDAVETMGFDAGIMVVRATDGPLEATRRELGFAGDAQLEVPYTVLTYLTGSLPDEATMDAVDCDTRECFEEFGYDGDELGTMFLSAEAAADGNSEAIDDIMVLLGNLEDFLA